MKEISLNILDIAENSVKAGATQVDIRIVEDADRLTVSVRDNGCGMSEETVKQVQNPFYTTRTTRRVGLGLPLLTQAAEQTGGRVTVHSRSAADRPDSHGTDVQSCFVKTHIDCPPLGDTVATLVTLIQGHPDCDLTFSHERPPAATVALDTRLLRRELETVPLNTYEVLQWIDGFLREQYS